MCTKSSTDRDDPRRLMPYTEMLEPMRATLRSDSVEPSDEKSSTDKTDPRRMELKIEKVEPILAKLRTDSAEPK
jgi:hypothetical protein